MDNMFFDLITPQKSNIDSNNYCFEGSPPFPSHRFGYSIQPLVFRDVDGRFSQLSWAEIFGNMLQLRTASQ